MSWAHHVHVVDRRDAVLRVGDDVAHRVQPLPVAGELFGAVRAVLKEGVVPGESKRVVKRVVVARVPGSRRRR